MTSPVFLIGAGFNVDAAAETQDPRERRYPVATDLARRCFGVDPLPPGQSVETLFEDAIRQGNRKPIDELVNALMEADYYVAQELAGDPRNPCVYRRFLDHFDRSNFLTFNYDSLIEIILLRLRRWLPGDGYGVPVLAETYPGAAVDPPLPERSANLVLHLHGSLCVYPIEYVIERGRDRTFDEIRLKDQPDFVFDPDATGHCFAPYIRATPGRGYQFVRERIIAPVPNKAEGLAGAFARQIHDRAVELVRQADQVVAIGYRFNPLDRDSYHDLITAVGSTPMLLVLPEACEIAARLASLYRALRINPVARTFRDWVRSGFPGICV